MYTRVMVQKIMSSNTVLGQLENSLCQPSSKWVPFYESGQDKAPKGEEWAPAFICCARDKVDSPNAPTATRLWDTFTFTL